MSAAGVVEHCTRCGLDVAAWRIEQDGRVFCSHYCASRAGDVAPAVDEGHCGDTQRGCWRPERLECVCRCVRCAP